MRAFAKKAIGIHVSDHFIRFALADSGGNITALEEVPLREGVVRKGIIVDRREFTDSVGLVLKKLKVDRGTVVVCGVPEQQCYVRFIPALGRSSALTAEQFIRNRCSLLFPFVWDEVYAWWAESVIPMKDGGSMDGYAAAIVPRAVADAYVACFDDAGVRLQGFVPEMVGAVGGVVSAETGAKMEGGEAEIIALKAGPWVKMVIVSGGVPIIDYVVEMPAGRALESLRQQVQAAANQCANVYGCRIVNMRISGEEGSDALARDAVAGIPGLSVSKAMIGPSIKISKRRRQGVSADEYSVAAGLALAGAATEGL